jgi:uncharacterized membrane protein YtjA (UPF0391 family)
MFSKLEPVLIVSALGGLCGFGTLTGVDTVVAQIMVGSAVSLVIAILVIGLWDRPFKDPVPKVGRSRRVRAGHGKEASIQAAR